MGKEICKWVWGVGSGVWVLSLLAVDGILQANGSDLVTWEELASVSIPMTAIHKCPDPWHRIKNCLQQWAERVLRFYERYIRENGQARKRETTQLPQNSLNQGQAATHRDTTARENVVNKSNMIHAHD